jgi:hypothetical protein
MKKLAIVFAVLGCLLMASQAKAADTGQFMLSSPAISGDICYDLRDSALGFGPSYTLGTFGKDGLFEIKGQWVIFTDKTVPNKLGAGIAVSIPKALKAIGVQNIPSWFTLSVGVMGLLDVQDQPELSVGIYATVLSIPL